MADLSDVENALVALCAAAAYPGGTSEPSAVGVPLKVYRGWPSATALDNDLSGPSPKPPGWTPTANVSVFPISGMTRLTTRFPRAWLADGPGVTTLTATASAGTTVTVAGSSGVAQLVGIRSAGLAYVYPATTADNPSTAAAALAALVPGAVAAGPVITVPHDSRLAARVAGFTTIRRELRRQVQGIRITIWAPDRVSRDAIGAALDLAIARANFIDLPDGPGRLTYTAADVDDVPLKSAIWKRDFRLTVEYPTTEVAAAPAVLWGIAQQADDGQADPDVVT